MRFAVTGEHRLFYQNKHAIELEELCSSSQLKSIQTALDLVLAERLAVKARDINLQKADALFSAGRDVWRANPIMKKLATNPSFADVAAHLTEQNVLRLGYDQYFPPVMHNPFSITEDSYTKFLKQPFSLEDVSSLQGVLCGLMLCLKSPDKSESKENVEVKTPSTDSPIQIFAKQAGNGIFFSPQSLINWQELFQLQEYSYLLIVYTHAKPVYVHKDTDPNVHSFKKYGYSFGDRLLDKTNPIVHK